MNYATQDYYDEFYRIFSCVDTLLAQPQVLMIGECLRNLAAGENISYQLERLYRDVENNPKLAEPLDNFIHQYTNWVESNDLGTDDPQNAKEDFNHVYSETSSKLDISDNRTSR